MKRVTAETLFAVLAHGDESHMRWLRDAINAHFAGAPVPAPYGAGRAERYADALRVIRDQSVYEWSEKRSQLHDIIDAQRDVARAALGDDKRLSSKSVPSVEQSLDRGASSKKPSPPQTC